MRSDIIMEYKVNRILVASALVGYGPWPASTDVSGKGCGGSVGTSRQ